MTDIEATTLRWLRQSSRMNTEADERSPALTTDALGNTYIAHFTEGSIEYGAGLTTWRDVVVTKLDSTGSISFARQLPQFNMDPNTTQSPNGWRESLSIAVDNTSGAIYVAGATTTNVPGKTNSGKTDVVLLCINAIGSPSWNAQSSAFNTSEDDVQPYVTVDSAGNPIVAFTTITNGASVVNVCKFSSSGSLVWKTTDSILNTTLYNQQYPSVGTDASNNIFVVYQTNNFLGNSSPSQNPFVFDTVIAKLNSSNGSLIWKKQEAAYNTLTLGNTAPIVRVDGSGNAVFAYCTSGQIPTGTNSGIDCIIVKVDTAGKVVWTFQQPTGMDATNQGGNLLTIPSVSMTLDPSGNVLLAFVTTQPILPAVQTGSHDISIIKIHKDGYFLCNRQDPRFNSSGEQTEVAIGCDPSGNPTIAYITTGSPQPMVTGVTFLPGPNGDNGEQEVSNEGGARNIVVFLYELPTPLTLAELQAGLSAATSTYNNYNTNTYMPLYTQESGDVSRIPITIRRRLVILQQAKIALEKAVTIATLRQSIEALNTSGTLNTQALATLDQANGVRFLVEDILACYQTALNTTYIATGSDDYGVAYTRMRNAIISSQLHGGSIGSATKTFVDARATKVATSQILGPSLPPPVLFNTDLISPSVQESIQEGSVLTYGSTRITAVSKGVWKSNTVYTAGDLVRYPDASGKLYMCIVMPDPNGVYAGSINNNPTQ
jgi:hypothetical protein